MLDESLNDPGDGDGEEALASLRIELAAGSENHPEGVKTLLCLNPSTGQPLDEIPCATPEDVDAAVEQAQFAYALWRGTPFRERTQVLEKLSDLLREQADEIAELVSEEQGKPKVEALHAEVLPALDQLRYLITHAHQAWSSGLVRPRQALYSQKRVVYLYEPLGIVSVVTPCNLPFSIPMIQVASAMTMGNAVLLKPSELAPLSGMRVAQLCVEAGFPEGLVTALPTTREDALYVIAHPDVQKIFVTGTPETGQRIMATAGCIPREVALFLGGKHPAVVAADANLDRAARGITWGALANCGQNCGAVERVYVEESVASRFLEKLLGEVGKVKVGDPAEPGTDVGPLVSEEHRARVHEHVEEAVAGGAKLLRGGRMPDSPGFFYEPTVVLNPPEDCRLMRKETLGPVIPVVVVENLERAILLANQSDYALTASGWTTSPATSERMMVGLQAGMITVNDVLYPFGEPAASKMGFRLSGFGPFQGLAGLREMCRRKLASFDPSKADSPVLAFPYDQESATITRTIMTRLHAGGLFRRLGALHRLFWTRRFRSRVARRFFFTKRLAKK